MFQEKWEEIVIPMQRERNKICAQRDAMSLDSRSDEENELISAKYQLANAQVNLIQAEMVYYWNEFVREQNPDATICWTPDEDCEVDHQTYFGLK